MKFVLAGYGSRGDVEPFAALSQELLRRGHDVNLALPPNMLGLVDSAGIAAVPYGPDSQDLLRDADFVRKVMNPLPALPEVVEHVNQAWVEKSATLSSLADGADLMLAGLIHPGPAPDIAEYYGIPLVTLHFFPPPVLPVGRLQSGIMKEVQDVHRRVLGLPSEILPSAPQLFEPGSLEIQAYEEFCFPGLALEWAESASRRPFVGALSLELPTDTDEEVLSWIAAGTPPIYFGFGSTPLAFPADTVAMISAACAQMSERALICSGPNCFGHIPIPGHVKVVEAVNHATIFPACRAVVHHGGAGTTAAGLRAGMPTLILWFWLDQPLWADAVKRLKVGLGNQFR